MNTQFKIPKSFKDPLKLFHIVINNVISKNKEDEYLTHGQMANVIFNNGNAIHQSYLSIVTSSFGDYLIRYRNKYKFDLTAIKEHFPSFFGQPQQPKNILKEIGIAIKHEKSAVFKKRIGRIIYVTSYEPPLDAILNAKYSSSHLNLYGKN